MSCVVFRLTGVDEDDAVGKKALDALSFVIAFLPSVATAELVAQKALSPLAVAEQDILAPLG